METSKQPIVVYLGADHGGYQLKEMIKTWLREWGYNFDDCGALSEVPGDDYPQYAFAVAQKVASDVHSVGILCCRSGGGMVVAANKVRGARAIGVTDERSARHAREHDNANIISLAGDWLSVSQAQTAVKAFLVAQFLGERHERRVAQIATYETEHNKG